jgi:hypothetical protein
VLLVSLLLSDSSPIVTASAYFERASLLPPRVKYDVLDRPRPIFNNSLRAIVPLDEVLVVFRRAFVLRFGSTFDTTIKALKVLY